MEKFTSFKFEPKKINEDFNASDMTNQPELGLGGVEATESTKSEPAKFISKIFESREMSHIFHLQSVGEGSYAKHMALDSYYNDILGLNDDLIETYQGQYDIIGNYETIDSNSKEMDVIAYFIELAEFIKSTRKIAFVAEDTHLQNIIDEMVALIYKTLYKLRFLK
jgi:hypothetical protein